MTPMVTDLRDQHGCSGCVENINHKREIKMIYYQFTLRISDGLPMTMKTRYRSYDRAIRAMNQYIKSGLSGCMVTLFVNSKTDYGMKEVREF